MKLMPELKIVEVATEDLVEYANNAKLHPAEQIDQIAESIEKFGFNNPVLAWHNDEGEPEIVAGHGRLMAARKLGIEKLPVVFLDHMDEEQRRAYILVDNQLTMNSGFDIDILQDELDAIVSIDMSEFDFQIAVDAEIPDDLVDHSDRMSDILGVFIACANEEDQRRTYERILESGYECRLLTL